MSGRYAKSEKMSGRYARWGTGSEEEGSSVADGEPGTLIEALPAERRDGAVELVDRIAAETDRHEGTGLVRRQ
jgi:hypothetical protein